MLEPEGQCPFGDTEVLAERGQRLHALSPDALDVAPRHEDTGREVVRQVLGLFGASVDLVDEGVIEDVL